MITRAQVRVRLLGRDVDGAGFVTHAGELKVWRAFAGLPDGARVYVDLGATRHVSDRLLRVAAEHLGPSCELIIEGPRPDVVRAYLAAIGEVA